MFARTPSFRMSSHRCQILGTSTPPLIADSLNAEGEH
jgi:hypothetical protein